MAGELRYPVQQSHAELRPARCVAPAEPMQAVIGCPFMDRFAQNPKSTAAGDIAFGLTVAAAGLVIAAVSFVHLGDKPHVLAQTTQPAEAPKAAPAEPGGTRPTTPAPEPARPDADAQKAGAKPALPPAPAEKMGEPVPERK